MPPIPYTSVAESKPDAAGCTLASAVRHSWSKFIFGMDAHPKVVQLAEALPEEAWRALERLARYEIATEPRRKPQRIKEAIVRLKGYLNKKLVGVVSWPEAFWRGDACS